MKVRATRKRERNFWHDGICDSGQARRMRSLCQSCAILIRAQYCNTPHYFLLSAHFKPSKQRTAKGKRCQNRCSLFLPSLVCKNLKSVLRCSVRKVAGQQTNLQSATSHLLPRWTKSMTQTKISGMPSYRAP